MAKVRFSFGSNAYTLLEVMTVVGIIGMLAAMAIPYAYKPRVTTQTNVCIKFLRLIEAGKEQLAFEAKLSEGATVVDASVNSYLRSGTTPVCPASGTYTYNPIGSNATCTVTGHMLPD